MRNVFDFGATGDGVADDTKAFQDAAAQGAVIAPAAKPGGGAATYRVNEPIEIESGLVELDGTMDISGMPAATGLMQQAAIKATGSHSAIGSLVSAAHRWSRKLSLPNSGLTNGDLIIVQSDDQMLPGMTRGDRRLGELVLVLDASDVEVTLMTGTYFQYPAGATVSRINTVSPRIRGGGKIICGGEGSGHNGIIVSHAMDPRVEGITVIGGEDTCITYSLTYGGIIRDVTVANATSGEHGTTGYGIGIYRSVGTTLDTFYARNCRHGVSGNGNTPTLFVRVHNGYSDSALLDAHEPCFEWRFDNNHVRGVNDGILNRGQHTRLTENQVTDSTQWAIRTKTWDGVTVQDGVYLAGGRVVRSGHGIIVDGRATGEEPASQKRHVVIDVPSVDDVYSAGQGVAVFYGTSPVVSARVTGGSSAGVSIEDSQQARVEVDAIELGEDVKYIRSTRRK